MQLEREFLGLKMRYPVMNGSGIFSHPAVLKRLAPYFGAVVTKSTGIERREGYDSPVFVQLDRDRYANAVGLSNQGYLMMRDELTEVQPIGIPIFASVFGSDKEQLVAIASALEDVCDGIKINYSCPHPKPGELIGMVLGSDPVRVHDYTRAVKKCVSKKVIAKLSPNLTNPLLIEVAHAAVEGGADALSAINTVGPEEPMNAYGVHALGNRKGGISGRCIKERGIEVIGLLREEFPDVPLIGMGGIYTAGDIADYMRAGADVVAMGTAFDLMSTEQIGRYLTGIYEELGGMDV